MDKTNKGDNLKKENKNGEKDDSKALIPYKPDIYHHFVEWLAIPLLMRVPREQREFAAQYGIHPNTLTRWKKKKGFWDEVENETKHQLKERNPDVIMGIFAAAIKGNPYSQKIWLQYMMGWVEKVETGPIRTLEDILKDAERDIKQKTDRRDDVDSKQGGKEGKVSAKPSPAKIPEGEKKEEHHPEGKAKGV